MKTDANGELQKKRVMLEEVSKRSLRVGFD
jgi:hypothetical protein